MVTLAHRDERLHALLTDQGACVHVHHEAEHDDGDPENGPGTRGFPAWDEYSSESHFFAVDERGLIVHTEVIDWALMAWLQDAEDMT